MKVTRKKYGVFSLVIAVKFLYIFNDIYICANQGFVLINSASAGPGFVNRDWYREIFPFCPVNEIGTGNSIS